MTGAPVIVSDCTLREGEQQPGIVLDGAAKMKIAELLARVGVRRAEIGTPAVSVAERDAVAEIAHSNLILESIAVCRVNTADVDLALECGVWGVVISSPVSPWQLGKKLEWSLDEMIGRAADVHEYARSRGLVTFASAYDTFRTPWRSLAAIYGHFRDRRCVDGVRVVDTVGAATPAVAGRLVRRIKAEFGLPVEVHFHDDFGLAMANAVSAVAAGCDSVSCSVAGVGERAGNVATEEIVAALELLYDVRTGIKLDQLGPVCAEIIQLLEIPSADQKAVVGRNAFRHVAGLSVGGFLRDPLVAQPIKAEVVGRTSEVCLGKTSGHAAVEYRLGRLGIAPGSVDVPRLVVAVKQWSETNRSLVNDADLLEMATGFTDPSTRTHGGPKGGT
jgi:isopropylmalate/homocitrate/citramalate synthase